MIEEDREIDIVGITTVHGYEIVLSIECRDHARPADVTWVEGMAKKHEHLPTSKLVLWSRSGFTKAAHRKAAALKIDTVLQGEIEDKKWAEIALAFVNGMFKYVEPKFSAFVDVEVNEGMHERFQPCDHFSFGTKKLSAKQNIGALLPAIYGMPEIRTIVLDNAPEGESNFYVEWKFPDEIYVWNQEKRVGRLFRLGIEIKTSTEASSLEVRSTVRNEVVYTVATAATQRGEIDLLVKEIVGLPPALSLRFISKNNGRLT
ncbi:MAG: hypothetical protein KMY51_01430 [Desulfomicrobium sp.]|nr:hypothetical protein [Desulfomicrobium sp.]MBV1747154.1 hypothetical protein [Desulfomicrobium sp.]